VSGRPLDPIHPRPPRVYVGRDDGYAYSSHLRHGHDCGCWLVYPENHAKSVGQKRRQGRLDPAGAFFSLVLGSVLANMGA
jgi:hypothetical protein